MVQSINARNIGQTTGIYNPVKQRSNVSKQPSGNITTTPANDPNSNRIGDIANATETVVNAKSLYDKVSGSNIPKGTSTQDTGVDKGNNVESTDNISQNSTVPQEIEVDAYIDNNAIIPLDKDDTTIQLIADQEEYLKLNDSISEVTNNNPSATSLEDAIKQGNSKSVLDVINKGNNNYNLNNRGFFTDDKIVGARNLGDVKVDWWTARNVALPALQYAAQFNSLDSTNKWLQGGKTLQRIMQGFAGTYEGTNVHAKTFLDNYYISNFVDLADMAHNWHNRTDFANAMTGANTALSLIRNLGWEDLVGGEERFSNAVDGMALLNFGHSMYQLTNNWDKMNSGERTAAFLQTTLAGIQAYEGGQSIIKAFSPAADAATKVATEDAVKGVADVALKQGEKTITEEAITEGVETGIEKTLEGGTAGTINTAGVVSNSIMSVLSAYSMYKGIEGMAQSFGYGSANSRKSGAVSGAVTGASAVAGYGAVTGIMSSLSGAVASGATFGSCLPGIGTLIGAVVGAGVGVVMGSVKNGKSQEQRARDVWRETYVNAGVFSKANNAEGHKSIALQLADGSYYDVGLDGSGSRATDIRGTVKNYADPSLIANRDTKNASKGLLPYNVDYTNALDFVGSLMITGMTLPVGGSYYKNNTKEVPQMLGYMTNGITSNCGREFTQNNYTIMTNNVKSLYNKMGITNKTQMVNCISDAYFQGKLSKSDYNSMLVSSNLIYDDNGYQQAQSLMKNTGKAGMNTKAEAKTK